MPELPPIEKVVLSIYKHNKESTPVYFGILLNELQIEKKELNKSLDRLFDLCMIDAEWETVDGKWARCYHTSHAYDLYLEGLYKNNYRIEGAFKTDA